MPRDCEYILRVRTKPDLTLVVKCSLTGRACPYEGVGRALCTRRTFALAFEAAHPHTNGRWTKLTLLCSEDSPQMGQ